MDTTHDQVSEARDVLLRWARGFGPTQVMYDGDRRIGPVREVVERALAAASPDVLEALRKMRWYYDSNRQIGEPWQKVAQRMADEADLALGRPATKPLMPPQHGLDVERLAKVLLDHFDHGTGIMPADLEEAFHDAEQIAAAYAEGEPR
jgi:hypothetical protein